VRAVTEQLQYGVLSAQLVLTTLAGLVLWLLRREVSRLDKTIEKLDGAREKDNVRISLLEQGFGGLKTEVAGVRNNVHDLRSQLQLRWRPKEGDGG
jgi:hypothetical protein